MRYSSLFAVLVLTTSVIAEPIRLEDRTATGTQFRVLTEASFEGELLTPVAKDKPPEKLAIRGRSSIDYSERSLTPASGESGLKVLRAYDKIDFRKTTGDRSDEMSLRPAVQRVVIIKDAGRKAPFSPDGPLLYSEIDLLRRETMVAALAGLLPQKPVSVGDSWVASATAVAELTDIEKVETGELNCSLIKVIENGPRKLAEVKVSGTLKGVNEDGRTQQTIDGKLFVDLNIQAISYLKFTGDQVLFDDSGSPAGKVRIAFELSRTPIVNPKLADDRLTGVSLSPNAENTALLYDGEDTGCRFVYPRNWRVVRSTGRQITIDITGGSGVLITLDPPGPGPTIDSFLRESLKGVADRSSRLTNRTAPERLAVGIERFTLDTEEGSEREKVTLDHILIRQEKGGATMVCRVPPGQRDARMKEMERLARSFVVTRRLDGK